MTKIRNMQRRLLLLHHAAKCPHNHEPKLEPESESEPDHNDTDVGTVRCQCRCCPVTRHCAEMKLLWKHMEHCQDIHCTVAHCYSSRKILSHYTRCQDRECRVCGSVRPVIHQFKVQQRQQQQQLQQQQQQQQQQRPEGM